MTFTKVNYTNVNSETENHTKEPTGYKITTF